eukprot:COSAG01_NODE_1095_length_11714_cov_9.062930_5_plen_173_part_00
MTCHSAHACSSSRQPPINGYAAAASSSSARRDRRFFPTEAELKAAVRALRTRAQAPIFQPPASSDGSMVTAEQAVAYAAHMSQLLESRVAGAVCTHALFPFMETPANSPYMLVCTWAHPDGQCITDAACVGAALESTFGYMRRRPNVQGGRVFTQGRAELPYLHAICGGEIK